MIDESRIVALPGWLFPIIVAASGWLSPLIFVINVILEMLGIWR